MSGAELGARLRERDLSAAPAALNLIENRTPAAREQVAALLAEVSPARLGGEAPAHVVGVTGPPGAGKSTLLSALARAWREDGRTVAVLAVDPTSKRSGGALLGDRARIEADPADHQARFDLAQALHAKGQVQEAVDQLLELFRRDREWNDGAAKAQLFTIFDSLKPQDPIALAGRRRLSSLIFA